ncbi:hypothetical protein [Asaia sp. HN010]|uniref:hypothetical protein n=1 Tax=Asaia sp. HN010 TaxID=3081233 RepID=UPI0030192762
MPSIRKNWFYIYGLVSYALLFLWFSSVISATLPQRARSWLVCFWVGTLLTSFFCCYRPRSLGQGLMRGVSLGGSALWLAQATLPCMSTVFLGRTGWLRALSISFVLICEGAALIALLRVIFGRECDPRFLEARGIPPVVVRLMLAEARFWRRVLEFLTGR